MARATDNKSSGKQKLIVKNLTDEFLVTLATSYVKTVEFDGIKSFNLRELGKSARKSLADWLQNLKLTHDQLQRWHACWSKEYTVWDGEDFEYDEYYNNLGSSIAWTMFWDHYPAFKFLADRVESYCKGGGMNGDLVSGSYDQEYNEKFHWIVLAHVFELSKVEMTTDKTATTTPTSVPGTIRPVSVARPVTINPTSLLARPTSTAATRITHASLVTPSPVVTPAAQVTPATRITPATRVVKTSRVTAATVATTVAKVPGSKKRKLDVS